MVISPNSEVNDANIMKEEKWRYDLLYIPVGGRREIHHGYFDYKQLYHDIKNTYKNKGFDILEVDYEINRKGTKTCMLAKWNSQGIYNEYVIDKWSFVLELEVDTSKNKEFEVNGKKKDLNYGWARLHLMAGGIYLDYQGKKRRHWLMSFFE
jgi:hypothetical protein